MLLLRNMEDRQRVKTIPLSAGCLDAGRCAGIRVSSGPQKVAKWQPFHFMYIVYILYSVSHDRFYIGQTSDFTDRLHRHNSGFEKSTAPYKPWILKLFIEKKSRDEAMILEKKLKNLNHERLVLFINKYSNHNAGQDDPA
jgi:putative endonuclease